MVWGIIALITTVVSFVYSTYKQTQMVKAQNRAQQEAKERAEKAKGFQYVEEGEAKAVGIPFGRNKLGGVRVFFNVKTRYVYKAPPVDTTYSSYTDFEKITAFNSGGLTYTSGIINKTGTLDNLDSCLVSKQSFNRNITIQFTINSNGLNKEFYIGFGNSNDFDDLPDFGFSFYNGGYKIRKYQPLGIGEGSLISYPANTNFKLIIEKNVTVTGQNTLIKWFVNNMTTAIETYDITNVLLQQQNLSGQFSNILYQKTSFTTLFVKALLKTPNTQIINFNVSASESTCDVIAAITGQKSVNNAYHLVNSDPSGWTGNWSLITESYDSATMGPQAKYVTRKNFDWRNFPEDRSVNPSVLVAPTEDHIYITNAYQMVSGSPVFSNFDSYRPPDFSSLNVSFPAEIRADGNNNLAPGSGTVKLYTGPGQVDPGGDYTTMTPTNRVKNANEYLFFQQALSFAGLNKIVYTLIDERPIDSPEFSFGAMIYYYRKGNIVCPWITAEGKGELEISNESNQYVTSKNAYGRSQSLFSKTAYFTGCFKLNRDTPQYSGTPNVQTLVEGLPVRNIVFNKITNTYTLTDSSYSNNSARVLLEYLLNTDYGRGLDPSKIDLESFYNAIRICDRIVVNNAPKWGNFWNNIAEPRKIRMFECNLTLDSTSSFRDNVEKILATMYMGELVWSYGKYKLQLLYPRPWSSTISFQIDEVVQISISGKYRLFKSLRDNNLNYSPVNSNYVASDLNSITNNHYWIENVVVAEVTDDDLIQGEDIQIEWPAADSKLNYCTVRFLNEDLDFKEDIVHWPTKEPSPSQGNVYQTFLQEDNNIALEADFFETGVTTYAHALAAAEQRVRFSRSNIVYTFKTTARVALVEPGDIIGFSSQIFSIPHLLLKVTDVSPDSSGVFSISGFVFDANLLAWNANDTSVTYIQNVYQLDLISQASDLEIIEGQTVDLISTYTLKWNGVDGNSKYIIKITTDTIQAINENTVWTDLLTTSNSQALLPPLSGTYTIAVVTNRNGKLAPFRSIDEESSWPLLRYEFIANPLFSTKFDVTFKGVTALKQDRVITAIQALLIDNTGIEYTNSLKYRWSDITNPPGDVITTALNSNINYPTTNSGSSKYGFRTTAAANANLTPTSAELGVNLPSSSIFTDEGKALVINRQGVISSRNFQVEILDTISNNVFIGYITIQDSTDPYIINLRSDSGDKFLNNIGSKFLWPIVFNGATQVTDLSNWKFHYFLDTKDGAPGGFIDSDNYSNYTIISNSAWNPVASQFSIQISTNINIQEDQLIKISSKTGIRYFKVKVNSVGNVITLKSTLTWPATDVTSNLFINNKLRVCVGFDNNAGEIIMDGTLNPTWNQSEDFKIKIDAEDIDYTGQIRVLAYSPN